MLEIFKKTIHSLTAPQVIKYSVITVIISAIILTLFVFGIITFFTIVAISGSSWLNWLAGITGTLGASIIAWFLFPLTTPLIAGIFQEDICNAIDRKQYPNETLLITNLPFISGILHETKLVLIALIVNVLLIPIYFIPIINIVAYYTANSYFIGRGFFDLIASRYYGRELANTLRKKNIAVVMGLGFLIVLLAKIPLLNIFMPIFGTILMVHTVKTIN